jgi:hypothetical protein
VNIVKGTYEPTDTEAKCAFEEDEVGIMNMNKYVFFYY